MASGVVACACVVGGAVALATGVGAPVGLSLLGVAGVAGAVYGRVSMAETAFKGVHVAIGDMTKEENQAFGADVARSSMVAVADVAIPGVALASDIIQFGVEVSKKGVGKAINDEAEAYGRYISHYPPANDTAAAANNAVQESPESNSRRVDAAFNLPRPDKLAIEHSAMTKMADHMTNRQNVFTNASHGGNALRSEYSGPVIMQSKNYTLQNMGNGAMVFHKTKEVGDIPDKNIQNEDVVHITYEGGRCSVKIDEKREVNAMWWTTGADGLTR